MEIRSGRKMGIVILLLLPAFAALGCGGGQTGPKRYAISGTVTREGIDVDSGSIMFVPESQGGIASAALIKDGKYRFTSKDGLPAGAYKVVIIQDPLRDPNYKGKKNEAPRLEDTRFKGKMPPNGWVKEAEVMENHSGSIDFEISETDGGEEQVRQRMQNRER